MSISKPIFKASSYTRTNRNVVTATIQREGATIKKRDPERQSCPMSSQHRVFLASRSEQSGNYGLGRAPEELCWSAAADFAFLVNR